jgi:hypothetical protein
VFNGFFFFGDHHLLFLVFFSFLFNRLILFSFLFGQSIQIIKKFNKFVGKNKFIELIFFDFSYKTSISHNFFNLFNCVIGWRSYRFWRNNFFIDPNCHGKMSSRRLHSLKFKFARIMMCVMFMYC